jgi:hypothetical protein
MSQPPTRTGSRTNNPCDKTQQASKTLSSQTIQIEQQIQHKPKLDKPRTNEPKLQTGYIEKMDTEDQNQNQI